MKHSSIRFGNSFDFLSTLFLKLLFLIKIPWNINSTLTIQLGKALYFKKKWPLNKCPSSNNCKALTREYYRTKYIHMYNKSTTVQACSYTMRNVSETREKSSEPLTSLVIYTLIAKYVFIIWCKKYLKLLISTQVPLESYLLCHVHWRKVWKNEILHFC